MLKLLSGFSLVDLFPNVKYIDVLTGTRSKVQRIHRHIDEILGAIIREHELKRARSGGVNDIKDLIDVLLGIKDHGEQEIPLTTDNIKSVILDMFVGGSETSSTVVGWAMSELMKNPHIMEKAKAEVRRVLKGKTKIEVTDIGELHYMNMVIKETLRLHTPIPMLPPREVINTCLVDGFDIPAGTRVFVNAWALARDPRYWGDDAEVFKPERFSNGSLVDYKGTSFEFVPFGAGRRICPGITFGGTNVSFTLANLLFHFNWEIPDGMKPEELDMTESFGVTAARKTDLCLLATPDSPTSCWKY